MSVIEFVATAIYWFGVAMILLFFIGFCMAWGKVSDLIKEWWFVIIMPFILWLIFGWVLMPHIDPSDNTHEMGPWGDSFGAFNALVSGLAFFILIKTLLTQREELALQRKELKATRKVLNHQREELKEQRYVMQKETFERTLFQFLDMIDQAYNSAQEDFMGDIFEYLINTNVDPSLDRNDFEIVMRTKSYFSLVSVILESIDETHLSDADKKFYCAILRDRIGEGRLLPLLWIGTQPVWCEENKIIVNLSIDRFQGLIEKYALFNIITASSLEDYFYTKEVLFSCFYKQTAFGERSDLDEFYSQDTIDDLSQENLSIKE